MVHDCGHVVYVFRTWLIVTSHGFHACDPFRAHDLFYEFWLVTRPSAADSNASADGFHTMTHYESCVAWREGMSHAGLGLREEPLYQSTLWAQDLGRCETGPQSFQHAVLTCPARTRARNLRLKEVSSLAHDAPIWSDPTLIRAQGEYITDTRTGFPPDMLPDQFSPPSTPSPTPR